jgi:hypothetical protein
MKNHPTAITISAKVDTQISVEDMAKAVSGLRYDKLRDFVRALATELEADVEKDKTAGRTKLASNTDMAISNLFLAVDDLDQAWKICSKYEEN